MKQILESNTYAAKSFEGAYDLRSLLQATLMEAGDNVKNAIGPLKEKYTDVEEILAELNLDALFQEWLLDLQEELDYFNLNYHLQ